MGAARERIVERIDIAPVEFRSPPSNNRSHGSAHRTEMHGHMRRIGNQPSVGVKQCAGEIKTLFDINRIGGVLQDSAHLLRDRHEKVIEDFEQDRDPPRCRPRLFGGEGRL